MKSFRSLILIAVFAAIATLLPLPAHGQAAIKIAAVDMSKVFNEYYKTKKAEAELKDRAQGYDKEMRERIGDVKKLEDELKKLQEDAENPAFTDDKRAEKRKAMETKLTEYRMLGTQVQDTAQLRKKDMMDQREKMKTTLVDEISKVIQDKAKKDGYTLVIDRSGVTFSGVSPFLFIQESLDITADIIKVLNAAQPAVGATSEKPKDKEKK